MLVKFSILRKHDEVYINSNKVEFSAAGIWICDDLETNNKNCPSIFIPYHNILQILDFRESK